MNQNRSLWCAALVMCVLVAPSLWAQTDQPSLADVARRKSATKAKRVVTNDEIPPSPEASLVAASSTPAAGVAPPAKKDAAKSDLPADKQTKMQELMKEHEDLQKVIKQLEDKLATTTDASLVDTLSPVLVHAKDALAKNQSEIDKLKAGAAASPPIVRP